MTTTKEVGYPMYADMQELILTVTKWLNETKTSTEDFYLHIELREVHEDTVAGRWSDEIAPDVWSFQQVEPANEEPA